MGDREPPCGAARANEAVAAGMTGSPQAVGLVILIDDERVDQMIYERLTSRSGMVDRALSFSNAPEALQYLRENTDQHVDMILLDVQMPCMTGLEFLQAATDELGPDFAASCHVMLSTELTPNDRARAEGFDVVKGFINKPLTRASFEEAARLVN